MAAARTRLPFFLLGAGVLYAALGLLDPRVRGGILAGPGLAILGLVLARRRGDVRRILLVPAFLAGTYALVAWTQPDFGADSPSYYVYLRSAFFDRDLEFTNEWTQWGREVPPRTATGRPRNIHAVGSAMLWSPFFTAAHAYVIALRGLGDDGYEADGFDVPYVRSTALGTASVAVVGAFLLFFALVPRFGPRLAAVGVLGGALASPVPYYLLVQPTMAHGMVFGLAAAFVWAWMRAFEDPCARAWAQLGALLGLLALTRWQAIVYLGLLVPLGVVAVLRRQLRPHWILLSALVACIAFVPQVVAWRALFGRVLAVPAEAHGMDWSSPHLLKVLLAADRGLFTWTPLMAVGAVGLVGLLRAWPSFATGALLVLGASAWVNGGVQDWAGADAFGARRFDLAVPLLAVGLTALARAVAGTVARRPWLVPAVATALMVAWNAGLMRLYRHRVVKEAAPLDRLSSAQMFQVRRSSENLLERLGGPRWRNLAYMFFVGEYFYWNTNLSGTIDVAAPEGRYLAGGWSKPYRRAGEPAFRWAYYPKACVRVPLEAPLDLRVTVTARAPNRLANQSLGLSMNHGPASWRHLPPQWTDVHFLIPASASRPGENLLCASFNEHLGAEEGAEDGTHVAAAVNRIQLP